MTGTTRGDIYELFDATFKDVSAYIIFKDTTPAAKIVFKQTSKTKTAAFVHWFGIRMVQGAATGAHRQTIACAEAARAMHVLAHDGASHADLRTFVTALQKDNGWHWGQNLERAGFTVLQAV